VHSENVNPYLSSSLLSQDSLGGEYPQGHK
jgi:hypothetical protein